MIVMRAVTGLVIGMLLPTGSPSPAPSPSPTATPTARATVTASPSPTPRPPFKTIVTVKSSPYCTALAQHFNSAFIPMRANDRTFDVVDVQLGDMNDMFKHPDYIRRFIDLRTKLIKESGILMDTMKPIIHQIDQLRASAKLSKDPKAQKQMNDAAQALYTAYVHQFQLSFDLSNLARAMMQYDIFSGDHPLSGFTLQEQQEPKDMKDIKSYLEVKKQRKSIDGSEDQAVNIAYSIAENHCAK